MLGNQVLPSSQNLDGAKQWREVSSDAACTLAPPSRKLDEKPLIKKKGAKKWEKVKKEMKVKSCIPKCKKEAVNSREALYNSGWPEAWVVQGGPDAPPYTPPCEFGPKL